MRHKMLNITYDWDNEQAKINYSSHFNAYDPLEMMDSLRDIIGMLEKRYQEAFDQFSYEYNKDKKNNEQD